MAKTLDAAGVKRLIQEIKGANKNLNAPIPISTENTPESMAQNVKNIADYVEKAKAAGVANVDGMGVTCLINGGISGLGYIYVTGNSFDLIGMTMWDDMVDNAFFMVSGGKFNSRRIAFEGAVDTVTSDMLVEGARKPIILTPSITEVDEETYQKLLSDDVDVILKVFDIGNICTLTSKTVKDQSLELYFSCLSFQGEIMNECYIFGYLMTITKISPHTCSITENINGAFDDFLNDSGYLNKSTLSPVLQEIDLTGTDADRKAKLDKFETDWKALTGASNLTGARFVGKVNVIGDTVGCVFNYDDSANNYIGIAFDSASIVYKINIVALGISKGSVEVTPLFSHLEAITIYTDNTPEHMQANLDNIAAYEANLQALGVDTTKGWNAPVAFSNGDSGILSYLVSNYYLGILFNQNNVTSPYSFSIRKSDGYFYRTNIITQATSISALTTTSKLIVPAINEINANAVHSDKLVPTLEAITIKTGNRPNDKAANVAAIKAYVDNLTALGVDTTGGYMIPAKLDSGDLDGFVSYHSDTADYPWSGVFIKPGGSGRFVGINKDGLVVLIPDILISGNIYTTLTTTSKGIIPAINEINANAVHKDKLVPTLEAITIYTDNTPEHMQANLDNIAAYEANLQALGVDTTKGYMISIVCSPIKYCGILFARGDKYYEGVCNSHSTRVTLGVAINVDGSFYATNNINTISEYRALTTLAKQIIPAINEVNALGIASQEKLTELKVTVGAPESTIGLMTSDYSGLVYNGTKFSKGSTDYDSFILPLYAGVSTSIINNTESSYGGAGLSSAFTFSSAPVLGETVEYVRKNGTAGFSIASFEPLDNEKYICIVIYKPYYSDNNFSFKTGSYGLVKRVENLESLKGKTILCLGDSITESKDNNGKSYSDYLAEELNANVINIGVGGANLRQRSSSKVNPENFTSISQAYLYLDVLPMAQSLATGDWNNAEAAANYIAENSSDDNREIVARAKSVDLQKVDIVTIFAGTNDFATNNLVWGEDDSTNPVSIKGAVNLIVESLLSANPRLKIVFFTPIVRYLDSIAPENWSDVFEVTSEYRPDAVTKNYFLYDIETKIQEACRHNHIPCCAWYWTLGWNKINFMQYFVAPDGTHPKNGYDYIGKKMATFLRSNL